MVFVFNLGKILNISPLDITYLDHIIEKFDM